MPELPEVETVVRDLRPLLVGRTLTAVWVGPHRLRRPWQPLWNENLVGSRVAALRRRAKWIILELHRGPADPRRPIAPPRDGTALLAHLGMTGQLTVTPSETPRADHTHLIFSLENGHDLRFRDVRRFGSIEWFPDWATVEAFLAERVGPEPFELDPAAFRRAICQSTRPLKAALLDQTVAAGVGNIYADEALHRAGLHPERRGPTVTPAEADRLREAIAAVLSHAIENRGSTIRDYIGGSGLRGQYQHEFRVYGRTGEPCRQCHTPIAVARVAGRSSHFCPRCQPIRKLRGAR
jgi:formamidopyrimidine-DNA glycosylase